MELNTSIVVMSVAGARSPWCRGHKNIQNTILNTFWQPLHLGHSIGSPRDCLGAPGGPWEVSGSPGSPWKIWSGPRQCLERRYKRFRIEADKSRKTKHQVHDATYKYCCNEFRGARSPGCRAPQKRLERHSKTFLEAPAP